MIDQKNTTSTGEPVTNRAPAPSTEAKAPDTTPASTSPTAAAKIDSGTSTTATTATAQAIQNALTGATLPDGYLAKGSMLGDDGVMLPEYIGEYAEELAKRLKPLKASTFNTAFITKAKEVNKKKVPYSEKKNCAQGMVVQAMKLTARKKDPAPALLLDMMKLAAASVVSDATFAALYLHLEAVSAYLLM